MQYELTSRIIRLSSIHSFLSNFLSLTRLPPSFAPEPTHKHTQSVTKQTVGTQSPQPVPHTLTALSQAAGMAIYDSVDGQGHILSGDRKKLLLLAGWSQAPGLDRCDWLLLRLLKRETLSIPDYCSGRGRAGLLHSVSPNTNHCEGEREREGEREIERKREGKKKFSRCGQE